MRNRVCIVLPFFTGGRPMPSYSSLFFETVAHNSELDLLVLSDCEWYEPRSINVTYVACTLSDVRERAQALFDFKICMDTPYKLCDYRPAYGLMFADYLGGYDFWGNCDMDMAFGNFHRFVTDAVLDSYDKVYQHGHLTLYRNSDVVNREFMSDYGMDYRKVFTTPISCVFDELEGVQRKFDYDGLRTYKEFDFLDIIPWRWHLSRAHSGVPEEMLGSGSGFDYEHECFSWDDGSLWRHAIAPWGVSLRTSFCISTSRRGGSRRLRKPSVPKTSGLPTMESLRRIARVRRGRGQVQCAPDARGRPRQSSRTSDSYGAGGSTSMFCIGEIQ